MVKVKRKVEMNLPQLIEWGWDNPEQIKGKYFKSNVKDVFGNHSIVQFSIDSFGFKTDEIRRNDTFTVEVEEEITLTTPLPVMLHVWKTGILGTEIKEVENKSIASQYMICSTEFWLKQGDEMTLIWKNGKLVG